jgi:hypothetical protein
MIVTRIAAAFGLLLALVGCAGAGPERQPSVTEVFTDASSQTWSARTFTCLEQDASGNCDKKTCKQGPGGAEFDCGSWGKACIDTGNHYEGTKEEGTCTRVKR